MRLNLQCKRLSKFGFVKGVRLGTRKLSPIFFKYQVLNPNHSGEGKICPLFSLFKIKINFTAVITLTHLSKLLFFDQSFLLFLSAIKTVSWLIYLNHPGGGICPEPKTQILKKAQLYSCTATTQGHIFWSIMFFL